MNTIGHTVSIEGGQEDHTIAFKKPEKATELLPEEALYLIERGSMFCWSQIDSNGEDLSGTPMSVQEAYMCMIGRDDLSLEKFQVSALLLAIPSSPE